MKFNTKAIHGGQQNDPSTGAVMPPIYQTSTYAQSSPGKHKGYAYSRTANPTRTALEKSFAAIENGTHGLAFSSGLAAIDCVLRTLKSGDEVIAGDDLYGGTYRIFTRMFEKQGLKFSYVDMNSVENVTKDMGLVTAASVNPSARPSLATEFRFSTWHCKPCVASAYKPSTRIKCLGGSLYYDIYQQRFPGKREPRLRHCHCH